MNRNKKVIKITTAAVAAAVITVSAAGGFTMGKLPGQRTYMTTSVSNAKMAAKEETLTNAAKNALNLSSDTDTNKEETVFVKTDAVGTVDSVTVSEWLKNIGGEASILDKSSLTGIENVKGEETFTQGEDGSLTWAAEGSDIYYQGKTDKELPVGVSLTYYLDDKEIAPEELAGKSGHVKIRIDYSNNEKKTVEINGKKTDIYTPFTMVSALMMENDNFSNVQVTNGKVVSDGTRNIVVGFGFPGLNESIHVDAMDKIDEGFELPDYVEVTADTTNFQLDMTMTVALSDLMNDIDLEGVVSTDELEGKIELLVDSANQLSDGTGELKDGTGTLSEKSGEFKEGVDTLQEKSGELVDGVSTLSEKSGQFSTGVDSLVVGIDEANAGAGRLAEAAAGVSDGAAKVDEAVAQAKDGSKKLKDGMDTIIGGYEGEDGLLTGTEKLASASKTVSDGMTAMSDGVSGMYTKLSTEIETYKTQLANTTHPTVQAQLKGAIEAMTSIKGQMDQAGLVSNTAKLSLGAKGIADGASALSQGADKLYIGNKAVQAGINQLYTGSKELKNGTKKLASGASTLTDGAERLQTAEGKLAEGGKKLQSGTGQLVDGIGTLSDGTSQFADGIGTLSDGTSQLVDGIGTLDDGAKTLYNGMKKFNRQGIKKIDNALNGDIQDLFDRFQAVREAGASYLSFAGIADGQKGNVKFIIETGAVTTEE